MGTVRFPLFADFHQDGGHQAQTRSLVGKEHGHSRTPAHFSNQPFQADARRKANPDGYTRLAMDSMTAHVQAMLDWQKKGAVVFDCGNNLRQRAFDNGLEEAFSYPGFVPTYIRPLFCEGKGPFRWVALSGDPQDIYETDEAMLELFPEDEHLARWLRMAQR